MPHLIEMRKVSKFYSGNDTVSTGFSKVDLDLDIGEFVVITGESGGGKSTLLNVISGLDTYEEGEMFVAGQDTSAFTTEDYENYRKSYIGNIFQDYNLVNSYSVYQNIELVMLLNGRRRRGLKNGIKKIIEWVGLTKYTRTKVSRLSGGQKQRVAIARAFAKDAPIIVADEPTGNLDSASAAKVMETLYYMSRDKLVIVVTHNYEQAEQYATRKIQMRDGRIIEDERIRRVERTPEIEKAEQKIEERKGRKGRSLSAPSQLRLGVRNTFNIPAKFLLLLLVYMFLSAAVIAGYASNMATEHETDLLGYNQYFFDTSPERIILHKQDKTAFTDEDYENLERTENIDHIMKNDLALDSTVMLESDDLYVEGPAYSASTLKESDLAVGELPQKRYEIVIGADEMSEAFGSIQEMGEEIIGKKYYIDSYNMSDGTGGRIMQNKVKVVGITYSTAENNKLMSYGYSRIYMTDTLAKRIHIASVAATSDVNLNYNGTNVSSEGTQTVFSSRDVPVGEAYIADSEAELFYKDGKALDLPLSIKVKNQYFESDRKFTVGGIFTEKNMKDLLGYENQDYDLYLGCVFINPKDYNKLYDQGDFQISVFMKNERRSEEAIKALHDMGFETLPMKDVLTEESDGLGFVSKIIRTVVLAVLFLALFFIAYAVIRLIMRSRNTYYTTLRILGATRGNTSNLLKIELLLVMAIAVTAVMVLIHFVNNETIYLPQVQSYFTYMQVHHYVILYVVMLLMSLLIAIRYSRKIFTRSAMNAYRGEA